MLGKNRIQEIREKKGYTVRHLAKLSGLNHSTITRIENHQSSPTFDTMLRLSKALNKDLWDVFYN